MGESICLRRSFSNPPEISSRESNEAGSCRFFTESVSFGRFASESLQWEKWSAFTQNRYLEEVERFTKPGSVAQKKAFFEAHFKNRAAGRVTETTIEEVSIKGSDEVRRDNVGVLEVPLVVSNGVVMDEVRDKVSDEVVCEVPEDKLVDSVKPLVGNNGVDMDGVNVKVSDEVVCEIGEDKLVDSVKPLEWNNGVDMDGVNVKVSDEIVCEVWKDKLVDTEVPFGVVMDEVRDEEVEFVVPSVSVVCEMTDVQIGEVKDTSVENFDSMTVPEGEDLDKEDSTSLIKEKRQSSSRLKAFSRSSKVEPSYVSGPDLLLKKARKEPVSSGRKSISVSKSQNRPPREAFNISISSTSSTKSAGKEDKKKSSNSSSVHIPLNVAPSTRPTTKTAPKSLARRSTALATTSSNVRNSVLPSGKEPMEALKSRKRPLSQTTKEESKPAKCSTKASVVRLPELPPPNNRLSEDKRKKIIVGSSVSGRIPHNVKTQPSVSCENRSTNIITKAKPLTVSSPFNFRSDERAEKRKEFFKKLEEKNKKEDTDKEQLFCGFKATRNTPRSLTSPRFRTNQTPVKTRNAVMEKPKSCKIHPSQTKKKTQENMSPNILQN